MKSKEKLIVQPVLNNVKLVQLMPSVLFVLLTEILILFQIVTVHSDNMLMQITIVKNVQ